MFFYFPLFGLFAAAGIIFLLLEGGRDNRTRLKRKNTLDSGEEDFYASLAAVVGIGRIGTAGYLCGKITPQGAFR